MRQLLAFALLSLACSACRQRQEIAPEKTSTELRRIFDDATRTADLIGRYQLHSAPIGGSNLLLRIDTATGATWALDQGTAWQPITEITNRIKP